MVRFDVSVLRILFVLALPFQAACFGGGQSPAISSQTQDGAQAQDIQRRGETMEKMAQDLLREIYASGKPEGFEQIDVHGAVVRHFPIGSTRAVVAEAFKAVPSSRIVEDAPQKLLVRDDRGQAMLDPDARSVVLTFLFDAEGKLTQVDAVHLKNQ